MQTKSAQLADNLETWCQRWVTSHRVCDVTCWIWGWVSVSYTCIFSGYHEVNCSNDSLCVVIMPHGKRLFGRFWGKCCHHVQGHNLIERDVEMGSVERAELVRYTRRLGGVFSTEGYSKSGGFRVQIGHNFLHLHITRTRSFPPSDTHKQTQGFTLLC